MKFVTTIITIGVGMIVHAVLAGPRWTKRSILDLSDPPLTNGSLNLVNNTAGNGSETNCKPLNDKQAEEKIISLGVLENPGVSLVNASGSFLKDLQANGTVIFVLKKRRKRDAINPICPEEAFLLGVLANEAGSLSYRIEGTRCAGGDNAKSLPQCSILSGDSSLAIGQCVKTVATIVLQVITKCGERHNKRLDIDCSCKCNKYSDY